MAASLARRPAGVSETILLRPLSGSGSTRMKPLAVSLPSVFVMAPPVT